MLEQNQVHLHAEATQRQVENNRRLDTLLGRLEIEQRSESMALGRSVAALSMGDSTIERGEASVTGMHRPSLSPMRPNFSQTGRNLSLAAAPFNPMVSATTPITQFGPSTFYSSGPSLYPPTPLSLTQPPRTTNFSSIPISLANPVFNTSIPMNTTQVNSSLTQIPVTTTLLPPLAYQAIMNSSLVQPNSQHNLQPTTQIFSPFKGLKVKLSFPDFDCDYLRGWIRRCEKYFELYQIEATEKMSYVAFHVKENMDTWFDVYMMEHGGL